MSRAFAAARRVARPRSIPAIAPISMIFQLPRIRAGLSCFETATVPAGNGQHVRRSCKEIEKSAKTAEFRGWRNFAK